MTTDTHAHPNDTSSVERARQGALTPDQAETLASLLDLLADPVRLRVLFALVAVEELCVGDLALTLDISMDQSSYALKMLRTSKLVQSRRDGRVIYYRLADEFPHQLLEHCLKQLLTISVETS
jgi:DNA-binding transcriptional ArsR family regulator